MRRLDYLQGLGVTCVWLQPFYPSPESRQWLRRRRLLRRARQARVARRLRGLHAARRGARHSRASSIWSSTTRRSTRRGFSRRAPIRTSFFRDWYVWSDMRPKNHKDGIVFPGQQTTTWTKDKRAGQYYFHRFYDHQPDLNTWHPVRACRDPEDHGLLAPARRVRLPHGRRAVPDRKEGRRDRAPDGFQPAEGDARFPAVALGRGHHAGRSERAAGRKPRVFRRRRRSAPDDAELPGEPAAVLCAGHRRSRSADPRARGHAQPAAERAVGAVSCAATTSSISAA